MKRNILVIAPHRDDETLGCGGTLLNHTFHGDIVHWLIASSAHLVPGFSSERLARLDREIQEVAAAYGFAGTHRLTWPSTLLDTVPKGHFVQSIADIVAVVRPHTLYLPYRNDAHSDHAAVFDAAADHRINAIFR